MAELGETDDPKALVPGDYSALQTAVTELRSYGDVLHEAGAGLRRIDTREGWEGKAADQFRDAFDGQPIKWLDAGDAFHAAGRAVDDDSWTLNWAPGQAVDALPQWNQAQAATKQAKNQHAKGNSPSVRQRLKEHRTSSGRYLSPEYLIEALDCSGEARTS